MLIQSNFRHPAIAATATPVRDAGLASVLTHARPCAISLYHANEVIYAQGDAAGPLYFVEFGSVRITRLTADGRRQIGAFHFAGEVFGFEAGTEHQFYAESVEESGIRVLRPTSSEGLGEGVLMLALKGLARAQNHLVVLGRLTATEKMATFLIDLAERQDAERFIDLPMQRNDIADYLGLTFETVSRVLRILKDSRVIRLSRIDQVEILDMAGLEEIAGR